MDSNGHTDSSPSMHSSVLRAALIIPGTTVNRYGEPRMATPPRVMNARYVPETVGVNVDR